MTTNTPENPENNPMRSDLTKPDCGIAYRRLKAFCDASDYADRDVLISHSKYSDDLSVKGKVNLVFGDIRDALSAIKTQSAEIERLRAGACWAERITIASDN